MRVNKYSTQFIDKNDINLVKDTLSKEFLTQGSINKKFEQSLSKYTKSNYSITLNSATSALHVACLSLGLSKDDILWTSVNSFVASSNSALYCGAKVDFIDIDLDTFNISIKFLENKLAKAKINNCLPKIITVVHLGGNPCNMELIKILSRKYKFKIIEDASHALGAKYLDSNVGSCKYSDVTIFSYYPVKMITTGEGGSLHTNDKKIFEKANLYRSHGIVRDVKSPITKKIERWYYEQTYLGFNYRMSDINAALGYSQLKKLNKFVKKRNELAKAYNKFLMKNKFVKTQKIENGNKCSFHLFIILIKNNTRIDNFDLINFLDKFNIKSQLHYLPIHLQPYYKKFGFKKGDFKNAELYSKKALSIPLHFTMTNSDVEFVSRKINQYFVIK